MNSKSLILTTRSFDQVLLNLRDNVVKSFPSNRESKQKNKKIVISTEPRSDRDEWRNLIRLVIVADEISRLRKAFARDDKFF